MFLDEFQTTIPFDALKYLTAECNYGGRVTDDKDRRLICTLLEDYYCPDAVENPTYKFALDAIYAAPDLETRQEYIDYVNELPLLTPSDVFGFHPNADITKDMNETNLLTSSLLLCTSTEGGGSGKASMEEVLDELCNKILKDFPLPYSIEQVLQKYPVMYNESMNTVLT